MNYILYFSIAMLVMNLFFLEEIYGKEIITHQSSSGCVVTGCSGHICADEEVITTCEYKEEYACYQNARCERQANGECGWTQTPELQVCLEGNNELSTSTPTPLDIENHQQTETAPSWIQWLPSPFRELIERILLWITSLRQ